MCRICALVAAILYGLGNSAVAQELMPSRPSIFTSTSGLSRQHLNPLGKPCLSLGAFVKAGQGPAIFRSTNHSNQMDKNAFVPKVYEHSVRVENSCGQNIKVQLCYYRTNDCVIVNVPPWGQKEAVLGIFPGLETFRYEAREQF